MNIQTAIKDLNIGQLESLRKNLHADPGTLKEQLNPKDFKALLQLKTSKSKYKQKIKSDTQEKAGNIAIILNTIITSVLGAWLGISGFIGLGLKSIIALIGIIILTTIISGYIAFVSFKHLKTKARTTINKEKLNLIELDILKYIIKLRKKEINIHIKKIMHALNELRPELKYKQKRLIRDLLLNHKAEEQPETLIPKLLKTILSKKNTQLPTSLKPKTRIIESKLIELIKQLIKNREHKKISPQQAQTAQTPLDYIKTLSTPNLIKSQENISLKNWIKCNLRDIILGVTPTLLGSFASMFVFLAGIPEVLEAFNIKAKTLIQNEIYIQITGIGIALSLSIYYCYSFAYSNYKNFLRDKIIEQTQQKITKENEHDTQLANQCNILVQIKSNLNELVLIKNLMQNKKKA